ncbi:hypothetical protein B9G55_19785 [Saccharibacillus sp. O16]|nr:hypothetical protein B9G55_19785 [Saccharibacillus sp. O16]
MMYQFETEKKDYRDFASGRVLHHAPNTTAFPVRLGKEIMSRCLAQLDSKQNLKIYDPCCGGAYLLTMLGFNYGDQISEIYGSDIDEGVLEHARRNLSLLTEEGLTLRELDLQRDFEQYGKDSHREALESVERLRMLNRALIRTTEVFSLDISGDVRPPLTNLNVVIADLPYGQMTSWGGQQADPVRSMLHNIYPILNRKNAIVAIICDKKQRAEHEQFERRGTLNHGKRRITFLKPILSEI